MKGTFGDGIDKFKKTIGSKHLIGTVEVDQVYAAYQHFRVELRHPRGGRAYYLQGPLFENLTRYMGRMAAKTITKSGSDILSGMIETVKHLSHEVETQAPVEFWDLRRSGHPRATLDGKIRFDRPPLVARLTPAQLRAKAILSRRLGHRF